MQFGSASAFLPSKVAIAPACAESRQTFAAVGWHSTQAGVPA